MAYTVPELRIPVLNPSDSCAILSEDAANPIHRAMYQNQRQPPNLQTENATWDRLTACGLFFQNSMEKQFKRMSEVRKMTTSCGHFKGEDTEISFQQLPQDVMREHLEMGRISSITANTVYLRTACNVRNLGGRASDYATSTQSSSKYLQSKL